MNLTIWIRSSIPIPRHHILTNTDNIRKGLTPKTKKNPKQAKAKKAKLTNTSILIWLRGYEESLMRFSEGMTSKKLNSV